MKKKFVLLFLVILLFPTMVYAKRGCCSHHGGVAGCSSGGRQICRDGTLSPTCTCSSSSSSNDSKKTNTTKQPKEVYGCTDVNAFNYNKNATKDNGSCIEKKFGCMDKSAINYDKNANSKDDSCQYEEEQKEIEIISYTTEYKGVDKNDGNNKEIVQKGKNGQKEVLYKIVVDQEGKEISKEKISEKIVEEPVKEIIETKTNSFETFSTKIEGDSFEAKKKEDNDIFSGMWILSLIISFVYFWTHKKGSLLLHKISNFKNKMVRISLYVIYVILIVPSFVDSFVCLFTIIKNKVLKNA